MAVERQMPRVRRIRVHGGAKGYLRLAVVLAFAVAGGMALGAASPEILTWIYTGLSKLLTRPPRPGEEPPVLGDYPGRGSFATVLPLAALGALVGAGIGTRVLRLIDRTAERWEKMDSGDKVTLFIGVFAGIIFSLPFLVLFQSLNIPLTTIPLLIMGLTLGFAALSVYALQSMDEMLPWSKARGRTRRTGIKILDTNVIIDGRIYDVAKSGFLEGQLYVPQFVLEELQHIADDHNALRRQRGRRGLEVLRHLQADFPLEVGTHDKLVAESTDPVDSRLVLLAKALGGDIVTNDFNLNRVAKLQDVKVLNLNDLSLSLRPNVLPQEHLTITVVREGNQFGQGVGYLDDGTMVVVENGKAHIGETLEVMVTQVIQTERGKMIFAEVEAEDGGEPPIRRQTRR
jgi:uncharacterized protein YacL